MDIKTIKSLKEIVSRFHGYWQYIIDEDNKFINAFLLSSNHEDLSKDIKGYLTKLNVLVEDDLQKAYELLSIRIDDLTDSTILLIMQKIDSFPDLLFGKSKIYGFKNKKEYLQEAVAKSMQYVDRNIIVPMINGHIFKYESIFTDSKFMGLINLYIEIKRKYNLNVKLQNYFKLRHSWKEFKKPRIDNVVSIGKSKMHLSIFFDHTLSNGFITRAVTLQQSFILKVIETELATDPSNTFLLSAKNNLNYKIKFLNGKSIHEFEFILLEYLKETIISLMTNNPNLILSPSFAYQLKITRKNEDTYANSLSTSVNYIVGFSINLLILLYLITVKFYDSIPLSFISLIEGEIYANSARYKQQRLSYGPISELNLKLIEISNLRDYYRDVSVYSLLAHETEHIRDSSYVTQSNAVLGLMQILLKYYPFNSADETYRVWDAYIILAKLYIRCRIEAISQFEELIVTYESKEITNYSQIKPIRLYFNERLMKDLSSVLITISKGLNFDIKSDILGGFAYIFSHIMNMVIFLAECKKKEYSILFMDDVGIAKFKREMPNALGFFMGYSHNILDKTKEEYSIIEELNVGKKDKFMEYLYKKRIRAYWLEDLQEFITKEKQVYIIRPPIDLMRQTMQKIQRTTELTYFEFYIKSCDLLGLSETVRVLSPNEFRNLAEKIMHAREVIRKKNGFR